MQTHTDSPPVPASIRETLLGLKPGESHLFADHPAHSVRAVASKVGGKGMFRSRKEGGKVRVWRREPTAPTQQ